jgi:DNA-3-methyladenine glycosylase I
MTRRCDWASNKFLIKYHDKEWGVPLHNDRKLFEFLILDGMQAGLSWSMILQKRIAFRKAFENFDPKKISGYKESKISKLLQTDGIIKNEQKIKSAINNAKRFLEVKKEFGSFDKYIWSFVNGKTTANRFKKWAQIPAFSKESEIMSKDMRRRGFTFVGPTICYAFMQSAGLVNDHIIGCFRRNTL